MLSNKEKFTISVIMPSYNSILNIKSAIDALIMQNFESWELLVIDGGSTDGTIDIIKEYSVRDNRIRLFVNYDDAGPAEARLFGIKNSSESCKYVAFLDSDDLWEFNKLKIQVEYMENFNQKFTYTYYSLISHNGVKDKCFFRINAKYNFNQYLGARGICNSSVILRRDIFNEILFKNYNSGFAEDTLLWLLIMKNGIDAYLVPHKLVYYRKTKNARSTKIFSNQSAVWKIYVNIFNISFLSAFYFYIKYLTNVMIRRAQYFICKYIQI
jgi:teichuronic acid biosynthesis glycosyltransferase TuaG